jgi:large subunit ribosomal protein L15
MPIKLHNLISAPKKPPKCRVGRGNASGHGTYSGKGLKGQKARSGVGGLRKRSLRQQLIKKLPKLGGFKSLREKNQIVNLGEIDRKYQDGEEINPQTLFEKGLIMDKKGKVKILGKGDLTKKVVLGQGLSLSKSVALKIQ